MAKRVLDHFGLTKYFRFVGGAEDDGGEKLRVKKDQVIQYVMDSCGLEKKDEIIMVGDRRHDIEGAEKTGISSVGVLYGYGGREELSAVSYTQLIGAAAGRASGIAVEHEVSGIGPHLHLVVEYVGEYGAGASVDMEDGRIGNALLIIRRLHHPSVDLIAVAGCEGCLLYTSPGGLRRLPVQYRKGRE